MAVAVTYEQRDLPGVLDAAARAVGPYAALGQAVLDASEAITRVVNRIGDQVNRAHELSKVADSYLERLAAQPLPRGWHLFGACAWDPESYRRDFQTADPALQMVFRRRYGRDIRDCIDELPMHELEVALAEALVAYCERMRRTAVKHLQRFSYERFLASLAPNRLSRPRHSGLTATAPPPITARPQVVPNAPSFA
ncbi:MAG TPA: hypothetical protein VNT60_10165 [Deinococcales bacterium]|nr:hypothetical protein [Deinococcales bacterium]